MAEWSKAPDSRTVIPCLVLRLVNSGPFLGAWVQIPLLTFPFYMTNVATGNTMPARLLCNLHLPPFSCFNAIYKSEQTQLTSPQSYHSHTKLSPNAFVSIFMRRITVLLSNFKIQFNKEQSEDGSAVTTCLLHCTLFSTIIPFNPIEPTAAADKQAKCPRTQLVVHKDNWIQLSHVRNYLQGYQ